MPYFFCKLIGPRPTFPFDMNEAEATAMAAHSAYWQEQAGKGVAIAVGPVFDPKGPFGVAIAEAADDTAMRAVLDADPIIQAGLGFAFEMHGIPSLILRNGIAAPQG